MEPRQCPRDLDESLKRANGGHDSRVVLWLPCLVHHVRLLPRVPLDIAPLRWLQVDPLECHHLVSEIVGLNDAVGSGM